MFGVSSDAAVPLVGGWSLYAHDGKLKHCYNFFGIEKYFAHSEREIPAGTHQVRLEFDSGCT